LKKLKKYGLFLVSLFFLVLFITYSAFINDKNYSKESSKFQQTFLEEENKLNDYLKRKIKLLKVENLDSLKANSKDKTFNLHVYRNDSLIFWNTNTLPILRFADIHFPSDGIIKLQNGWYYSKIKKYTNLSLVASFLIKHEYPYENDYLKSEFAPKFSLSFQARLILERENAYPIFSKENKFLFSIQEEEKLSFNDKKSNVLIVLFFLFISVLLFFLYQLLTQFSNKTGLISAHLVLLIHSIFLKFELYSFLSNIRFFEPSLYASSNLFPNLFTLILNCFILFFYVSALSFYFKQIKSGIFSKFISFSVFSLSLIFSFLIGHIYQSLIKDSSIPLEIDKLFHLNYYSFWGTLCIGILFFSYFILVRAVFIGMLEAGWRKTSMVVICFISGVLYFIFDIVYGSQYLFLALWPFIINGIIVVNVLRSNGKFNFNYGVILLFSFSVFISININNFYSKKEKSERELFANQLASDQDVSSELEFLKIDAKIKSDVYFQKLIQNKTKIRVSVFRDFMERKFYNGFWDRYDISFYLFNDTTQLINHLNKTNSSKKYLEDVLKNHSELSEISPNIYYIKDYTSQYSYIIKQKIYNSDTSVCLHLFSTLKSKRIPEKIGFPRLLVSNQSNVFKVIENYSIAKYYQGKLISQYGKFSYPTDEFALTKNKQNSSLYFENEDYNHFLLRKNNKDTIVLSMKNPSSFQIFTSFSYLFCFFGLILIIILTIQNSQSITFSNLTLAVKIQLILISIVVIALLAFGYGSGKFVSNQYNEYSTELVKEKIKSVQFEVKSKLGTEKELKIEKQGDFMESILEKFANVFVTDINLYDKKGYLLSSSRPKIFNLGLLSEQMNPLALVQLQTAKKSEFIHQENIGKLNYLSAYVPLFNSEGNFLAYINLQHFGQQQGFQNQIEGFLVAIINVFILLLAFSIILSILVSNWVTSPLKILQNSFAKVQLGKYNEPIQYNSNDEIGALVKNYNSKLEELALTAKQLAQSERESAWREMAKQVAHEIKNPLTPMKLSLQHLQRVFDPNDVNSKEKINKVVFSIIEQIDALTKIANEFSNFAKMPKENKEKIDVLPIIEHVIVVFNQENDIEIKLTNKAKNSIVFGDKDLILRVFNNLINNAIQAIPENKKGIISINLSSTHKRLTIEILDNGKGIPKEMFSKIFMPNFTTKSTGMGLGLAMVKQIIQLHEGEIWFESEENKTLFVVELPLIN
jgi:signal transduction histidine kinase